MDQAGRLEEQVLKDIYISHREPGSFSGIQKALKAKNEKVSQRN